MLNDARERGDFKAILVDDLDRFSRDTVDAAERRLAGFSLKGSRKPRDEGYPLTGVLICDHCG